MTPLPAQAPLLIKDWFRERGLILPDRFIQRIEIYHDLVLSWSERMNLVSSKDLKNLVHRHILDSLVPLPKIPECGTLADIGSGAGFPAIPLALVRNELRITMVEARHKKVLFLREACKRLDLQSIFLAETRLEEFYPDIPFDLVTIRALPGWESLLPHARRIMKPSGKLVYYEKPGRCRIIEEF
jgi:16S rRNA (guanine527-N7)-methyltransferase